MLNKYYLDELLFLREMGREFAKAYPEAAPMLSDQGADPDVERMIEGFAFLSGRIRQKLDDELPELTHSFLEMFWPHYLRPVPSMCVMQFEPLVQAAKETRTIARGAEVDSQPVDGTSCRFRTTGDVTLLPLTLQNVDLRKGVQPALVLRFKFTEGVVASKANVQGMRLHFAGDQAVTRALYFCVCRYLKQVEFSTDNLRTLKPLPGATVQPAMFDESDALLAWPRNSFPGFRLMLEYFTFPQKFMFVDVKGLNGLPGIETSNVFDLVIQLKRLPENMPPVSNSNVALNCVPAVNLFKNDADPIRVDLKRTEYRIRPTGKDPTHYEIFSVDKVLGLAKGTAKAREYRSLYRLARGSEDILFYRTRTNENVVGQGTDVMISFVQSDPNAAPPEVETISMELTCTNRMLPSRLAVGDINVPTSNSPAFAKFKNITKPTISLAPPIGEDLHWRLISHLSLNYGSLLRVETFRALVGLYNFKARVDRQAENAHKLLLDAFVDVRAKPSTRLYEGYPVRGLNIEIDLSEDNVGGEGDVYLLGAMLDQFLAQYVTLNAFTKLTVKGTKYGEIHEWPARIGARTLL